MDRPVKERLIGAVVLVTVAWLLIPVFLDAPSGAPQTEDSWVTLPRADDGGAPTVPTRRETIVLQEPRSEPEPQPAPVESLPAPTSTSVTEQVSSAVDDQVSSAPAEDSVDAPEVVTTDVDTQPQSNEVTTVVDTSQTDATPVEPPAQETPAPPPPEPAAPTRASSNAQMWAVQLGSFSNEGNAQRLAAQYRADGLLAFVSKVEQGGRTLHRVRIGPETDRSVSDAIVTRLTKEGQTARTVAHP